MFDRRRHIIISGAGRSGTTLLVQYFTAIGLDTGYSLSEAMTSPDVLSNAGLERMLDERKLPLIIKSPWFADQIGKYLDEKKLEVDSAIIPVRDLFSAAESRRRVYYDASSQGLNPLVQPGTIWKTDKPEDQEMYLTLQFYKLIESLVRHNIPIFFLPFPQFADCHRILYNNLKPILERYGVSFSASKLGHQTVVKRSLIHDFEQQSSTTVGKG